MMYCIIVLSLLLISLSIISSKAISNSWIKRHDISFNRHSSQQQLNAVISIRGGKNIVPKPKSKDNLLSISYWMKKVKSFIRGLLGKKSSIPMKEEGTSSKSPNKKEFNHKITTKSSSTTQSSGNSGLIRIQKELQEFMAHPPSHCKVEVAGSNIRQWIVTITGAEGTLYEGESYKLQFKFPKDYPSKPPVVYFLKPVPRHVHVYSNGDICLSLLGKGWSPGMTAESIAVSILSILSSAKEKKIPPDNALHSDSAPGMQQDNWMYHDDRC